ncbi:phage major capsid protein, P2 family [Bordetella sp. 2513F-2]
MRTDTRAHFSAYLKQIASLNGVEDPTKAFNVQPAVQQRMEQKIQESSEFLTKINMPLVTDQQGQKIGLGVASPVASRTDTTTKSRQTRDLTALDDNGYHCIKTNFDTHIPYARLDAWARFPDFQVRVRDALLKRQALDRIMIGFNGEAAATETDLEANPLLQDVNKGWLQKLRERAPQRVLNQGAAAGSPVRIGKGGDYANLDAAVFDLLELLDPWFQADTQLVAIVGRGLLHDKYFPLINGSEPATEKLAADIIVSQKRIGGLPAVAVPYFPSGRVLVTRYDNLSIYTQEGSRRRYVREAPERDRVEFYESSNDDYAVEDYGCAALLENIEMLDDSGAPVTTEATQEGQ